MLGLRTALIVAGLGACLFCGGGCDSNSSNESTLPKPPTDAQLSKLPADKRATVTKLLDEQRKITEQNLAKGPKYSGK